MTISKLTAGNNTPRSGDCNQTGGGHRDRRCPPPVMFPYPLFPKRSRMRETAQPALVAQPEKGLRKTVTERRHSGHSGGAGRRAARHSLYRPSFHA